MTHMMEQIHFHGDLLWAAREGESVLVAIKPICENLQIQWMAQMKRINRDSILSKGKSIMTLPSPGGPQETICLPLNLVPGWLFGIDDRRIRDENVREKVLDYKRECHDVLYRHFIGARYSCDTNTLEPEPDAMTCLGSQQWLVEIAMVREARRIHGVHAARALWHQLGLPATPEMFASQPDITGGLGLDDASGLDSFMAHCTVDVPGHRTRLVDIWQAYIAWCQANGREPTNLQNVGKRFKERYKRLKSGVTWYVGVELKQAAHGATH